jgi:hypothetical protein
MPCCMSALRRPSHTRGCLDGFAPGHRRLSPRWGRWSSACESSSPRWRGVTCRSGRLPRSSSCLSWWPAAASSRYDGAQVIEDHGDRWTSPLVGQRRQDRRGTITSPKSAGNTCTCSIRIRFRPGILEATMGSTASRRNVVAGPMVSHGPRGVYRNVLTGDVRRIRKQDGVADVSTRPTARAPRATRARSHRAVAVEGATRGPGRIRDEGTDQRTRDGQGPQEPKAQGSTRASSTVLPSEPVPLPSPRP